MLFLLTNDDGIDAPGLQALEAFARQLGDVVVVAPSGPRSGFSHRATMYDSMELKQLDDEHYACSGTPVDCVRVGLAHLGLKPDWVLSEVNAGANLGIDLYMSGTAGAAREAAILGMPAFAFSHYHRAESTIDWLAATNACAMLFDQYYSRELFDGEFWNVNFPDSEFLETGKAEVVEVAPDPSPLTLEYSEIEGTLQYKSHYHDRPRVGQSDVHRCLTGAITVSRVSLF